MVTNTYSTYAVYICKILGAPASDYKNYDLL
jgi:hypothetical protein